VYTVSGSVFYLLVKYQHHKERNSTKSTILALHTPTITAEITQQFFSYMSAKKASVTNHLFFVGFFFLAILYLKNCECSSIFLFQKKLVKKNNTCALRLKTQMPNSAWREFLRLSYKTLKIGIYNGNADRPLTTIIT